MAKNPAQDGWIPVFLCISVEAYRSIHNEAFRSAKTLRCVVNEALQNALDNYPAGDVLTAEVRKAIRAGSKEIKNYVSIEVKVDIIRRFREAPVPPFDMQTCISAFLEKCMQLPL